MGQNSPTSIFNSKNFPSVIPLDPCLKGGGIRRKEERGKERKRLAWLSGGKNTLITTISPISLH